jgi:hypothetical protein
MGIFTFCGEWDCGLFSQVAGTQLFDGFLEGCEFLYYQVIITTE